MFRWTNEKMGKCWPIVELYHNWYSDFVLLFDIERSPMANYKNNVYKTFPYALTLKSYLGSIEIVVWWNKISAIRLGIKIVFHWNIVLKSD